MSTLTLLIPNVHDVTVQLRPDVDQIASGGRLTNLCVQRPDQVIFQPSWP